VLKGEQVDADPAPGDGRRSTMSSTVATAAVVAIYVAGAVVVYWHVWSGSPSHDTQYGPDTALNTWFLGYFLVAQTNEGNRLAFTPTIPYTRDSLTAEVFVGLGRGQVPRETAALKTRLLAQFHAWRVTSVVVPLANTPNAAMTVTFISWLLGKPTATDVSGATVWYRV